MIKREHAELLLEKHPDLETYDGEEFDRKLAEYARREGLLVTEKENWLIIKKP